MSELKKRIEAILFASGKGVSEQDLAKLCDSTIGNIKKNVQKLQEEYLQKDSSLIISSLEDKWKLTVRGKYLQDIERLTNETELTGSVLKTLAIIAFKSPVLQSTIVEMRGQGAYDHVKLLVKEKFVTKEDEGRSYLLKITDKFYDYFDIRGDKEIKEVFDLMKRQQQKIIETTLIEAQKEQEKLLEKKDELEGLEIIEIEPSRKEESLEEKEEKKKFLEDIDKRIQSTSDRLSQEDIQIRSLRKEEEENLEEEAKEEKKHEQDMSETDSSKENKDEDLKNIEEEKREKENNNIDYKDELEKFAQEELDKDKDKEQYL